MNKYVRIDGGIGRAISATGAVKEFAKNNLDSKTFVISSFPQVFDGIEEIDRVYPINTPFIYEDHISSGEYMEPEPYNDFSYYKDNSHISAVFNKLLNSKLEYIDPIIILTENEKSEAKTFIENERKGHGKKIVLYQPWGSSGGKIIGSCQNVSCGGDQEIAQDESYRSLGVEFAKKLNQRLLDEGYQTYIIKNGDQIALKDAKTFNGLDFRKIIALIPYVDGIVCCDSFLHHASAALGNPVKTIVFWAGTDMRNVGYKEHFNLISWKKTINEPNRIPHDHAYYLNKNKGSNEFKFEQIDEVIGVLKNDKINKS